MKLVRPSMEFKDQVMEYRNEFLTSGESLAGSSYLSRYEAYGEWLQFVWDNEQEDTKHTGVTADEFLAIREEDNKLIGLINIRHSLTDYLFNFGGHIGYSVRREERRKGYGKEMLRQALEKCRKLNLKEVLITCDASNIASAKTILSCGGVLDNEVMEGEETIQRYWIHL